MSKYRATIGLEIHAELKTNTKMFCTSKNAPHDAEPNTYICPVCMAHPGTLPVINKEAVKHVLTVGCALKGSIATYTEFDRKNYFYADIPKGYQISQYAYPLVSGGTLAGVAITRIHLEEDTARSQHGEGTGSLVDFNRAGVPLMELVTEPVIHDAKTASTFAKELQLLLRTLGASDANMEKGEMRVEANVSISASDEFGTKVEVKNLNSFKAVEQAITYEVERQAAVLEQGGDVVQETRGWDETKNRTYAQRLKETAHDYRYFPDPDLPKLDISTIEEFSLSRLLSELPELPDKKRKKYSDLGISREQIETILASQPMGIFFDRFLAVTADRDMATIAANYLATDASSLSSDMSFLKRADEKMYARLVALIVEDKINSRIAKDLLPEVLLEGKDPELLASERNLLQNSSEEDLQKIVDSIIAEHPDVVAEYRGGKEASLQFLIGQGMKLTRGSANPKMLADLLSRSI